MISAKDISNKRFEKAAFGYKQEEVDDFLRSLVAELTAVQKEQSDMENKLQILADKVREYRQDEEALKDALLGAQKQGHRVIAEAQDKAQKIIEEAEAKASMLLDGAKQKYEEESEKINTAILREQDILNHTQKEVADFKKTLFDMYKSHLEMIASIPELYDAEDEETEGEDANNSVNDALEEKEPEPVAETRKVDPFATSSFPTQRFSSVNGYESRFGELQFGQNNK